MKPLLTIFLLLIAGKAWACDSYEDCRSKADEFAAQPHQSMFSAQGIEALYRVKALEYVLVADEIRDIQFKNAIRVGRRGLECREKEAEKCYASGQKDCPNRFDANSYAEICKKNKVLYESHLVVSHAENRATLPQESPLPQIEGILPEETPETSPQGVQDAQEGALNPQEQAA